MQIRCMCVAKMKLKAERCRQRFINWTNQIFYQKYNFKARKIK